jgi:DNA-binding transcriptional LysR family regulator
VAGAALLANQLPTTPSDLAGLPSLDFGLPQDEHHWKLQQGDASILVRHQPKFISDDLPALREAALRGIGVVRLPMPMVEADIAAARLIPLLPNWHLEDEIIYAVFPSRRGLLPSTRTLLDFLAGERVAD